jgi:predicted phosphodiesterase
VAERVKNHRVIVCPDAHHPFVDKKAWACFLQVCKVAKPDTLVIIGDFADFFAISTHSKHPSRRVSFSSEIDATNKALDQVAKLGIKRVVFTEGNHEFRFDRYIADKAPELYGVVPDLAGLFKIHQRPGWEWYPYRTAMKIGHIYYTHEVGRCGVNAVRQSLTDFGDNLVMGHTHRLGVSYQGTVNGPMKVCLNVGWLGDLDSIDYRHQAIARRESQHGFGLVDYDKNGIGWCSAIPIIDGAAVVDGRIVKA